VVAVPGRRPHGTEKLQPDQGDLLRVLYSADEVRGLGTAKGAARHGESTEMALFLHGFTTFLDNGGFQFAEKQGLCCVPEGYFRT